MAAGHVRRQEQPGLSRLLHFGPTRTRRWTKRRLKVEHGKRVPNAPSPRRDNHHQQLRDPGHGETYRQANSTHQRHALVVQARRTDEFPPLRNHRQLLAMLISMLRSETPLQAGWARVGVKMTPLATKQTSKRCNLSSFFCSCSLGSILGEQEPLSGHGPQSRVKDVAITASQGSRV